MIRVQDTESGKFFEVEESHWDQVLWRVKRYKKAETKPARRNKVETENTNTEE